MEDTDKAKLDELRKKHPSHLSESDHAFLHARRSYLHSHELIAFGIKSDEQSVEEESSQVEEAEPVKPTKKSKAKAKDEQPEEE